MFDVDEYFRVRPGLSSRLELNFLRWFFLGQYLRNKPAPPNLVSRPAPWVDKLGLIQRGEGPGVSSGLVVGTVRMGYGHHRVAAAAYSWALARGLETHVHDLLAIESAEADIIAGIDRSYSRMSRLASEVGGPMEWLWGRTTSRGNLDSLRTSCTIADSLKGLMHGIDPSLPLISSYPLNGQMAIASGFARVVNMVVDNHPQYFLLAPGAVNLVQSPNNYQGLRAMGVRAKDVEVGGHWVHHDIVRHLPGDCAARIERAKQHRARRLLLPVGGAGAQRGYVTALLRALAPRLRDGRLRVYLNTGDHVAMYEALGRLAQELQVPHDEVRDYSSLLAFCLARPLAGDDPTDEKPLTLCHFSSHFEAFSATDRLVRISDILATKPSELAFCPIPKLHLRRVGDHEAASAQRSAELGDGTNECRTVQQAVHLLCLLADSPEYCVRMNEHIARNAEAGIYNGAQVAVDLALSL